MKGIASAMVIGIIALIGIALGTTYMVTQDVYECDAKYVDVVIVTDTSGSMDDNCPGGLADPGETPCKINDASDAVKLLYNKVLAGKPINYVGLVEYGTNVKSYLELTRDNIYLDNQINGYKATGTTCISCGISKAIDILKSSTKTDKVIVIMSDVGESENTLTCTFGACTPLNAKAEAKEMATKAKDNGIRLYTVAFGSLSDYQLMKELAALGNGDHFLASETDIITVYQTIADVILCQTCNNDGTCDAGENCGNCLNDCPLGSEELCCNGQATIPECYDHIDCDDNDPCTTDTCTNPNSCSAKCTHVKVADNTKVGLKVCCGGVLTTPLCSYNTDCDDKSVCTDDKCNNAGLCSASCSNTVKLGYYYNPITKECYAPCSDGTEPFSCSSSKTGYMCKP